MHAETYLQEAATICQGLDPQEIESMAAALSQVEGRVYMIGLGGSLANCIHMAADLTNLCGIVAIAPNVAEITASINDQGPMAAFRLLGAGKHDALFVLSVGGGTVEVSPSIYLAVQTAKQLGVKVFGIVGPKGGETASLGDHVIRIPDVNHKHVTPHTETFQALIWHCLVSHPLLQKRPTKW